SFDKPFAARSTRCSRIARNYHAWSATGFDAMERRTLGAGQCAGIARLHLFGGRLCGGILDACLFSQSAEFHRTARSGYARAGNELWPGVAVGEYFARRGKRFARRSLLFSRRRAACGEPFG